MVDHAQARLADAWAYCHLRAGRRPSLDRISLPGRKTLARLAVPVVRNEFLCGDLLIIDQGCSLTSNHVYADNHHHSTKAATRKSNIAQSGGNHWTTGVATFL